VSIEDLGGDAEHALRQEIGRLLERNEQLEAKVMAYVDRSATMRDSVVRLRDKLKAARAQNQALRATVAQLERTTLDVALRAEGYERGFSHAYDRLMARLAVPHTPVPEAVLTSIDAQTRDTINDLLHAEELVHPVPPTFEVPPYRPRSCRCRPGGACDCGTRLNDPPLD
jgi:hypothetical protein